MPKLYSFDRNLTADRINNLLIGKNRNNKTNIKF